MDHKRHNSQNRTWPVYFRASGQSTNSDDFEELKNNGKYIDKWMDSRSKPGHLAQPIYTAKEI
jgi:hypothetical protein